jgi:hypothetical protein
MAKLKLTILIAAISAVLILDYTQIYVPDNFERPALYKMKVVFLKIGSYFVSKIHADKFNCCYSIIFNR